MTRLHSPTVVYTRLVTRLCFLNRSCLTVLWMCCCWYTDKLILLYRLTADHIRGFVVIHETHRTKRPCKFEWKICNTWEFLWVYILSTTHHCRPRGAMHIMVINFYGQTGIVARWVGACFFNILKIKTAIKRGILICALPAMKLKILLMVLINPEAINSWPSFANIVVQPAISLKIDSVTGVFYVTLEDVRKNRPFLEVYKE